MKKGLFNQTTHMFKHHTTILTTKKTYCLGFIYDSRGIGSSTLTGTDGTVMDY